jgi:hypothetical protein
MAHIMPEVYYAYAMFFKVVLSSGQFVPHGSAQLPLMLRTPVSLALALPACRSQSQPEIFGGRQIGHGAGEHMLHLAVPWS